VEHRSGKVIYLMASPVAVALIFLEQRAAANRENQFT
jgi:hypothetical protein